MNITKFIGEALKEAEKSKLSEWRIGAVIVRGGKIIGRGHNKFSGKIGPIEKKYRMKLWSLHAEMDAILDAGNVEGATLFIAGIKENGNKVCCKPCKDCLKIIKQLPFKDVFYENKHSVEQL